MLMATLKRSTTTAKEYLKLMWANRVEKFIVLLRLLMDAVSEMIWRIMAVLWVRRRFPMDWNTISIVHSRNILAILPLQEYIQMIHHSPTLVRARNPTKIIRNSYANELRVRKDCQ